MATSLTTAPAASTEIDQVDPKVARKVLDLAMRMAEYLLSSGSAANDVVLSVLRLTDSYGLRTVHVDVTNTAVQVSYYRGFDRDPLVNMRVIQGRSVDFTAHERIQGLLRQIELGEGLSIDEATTQFRAIITAPRPYPGWFVTAGNGGVAVGIVMTIGGGWLACLITFIINCAVDRLLGFLSRFMMPRFVAQAFCAFFIMISAGGVFWLGQTGLIPILRTVPVDLIVAGGIVMLVAGQTVVGAAQDAIADFFVTASARTFETVLMTAGIVVGILSGLMFLSVTGVNVPVSGAPIELSTSVVYRIFGAAVCAGSYAISTHAGRRAVLLSFISGAIGWVSYLISLAGFSSVGVPEQPASIAAYGLGALGAAVCAIPIATYWRTPALAGFSSALVPLVPGIMMYRGLLDMVGTTEVAARPDLGGATLFTALAIALSISAGVTLGTYLGRPFNQQIRRLSGLAPLSRDRLRVGVDVGRLVSSAPSSVKTKRSTSAKKES